MQNYFRFLPPIGLTDVADIAVVGVLLFVALRVLQRNVHRRVLFVFGTIALTYWMARTYRMELTSHFLEVIAVIAGVGFFLLFQEDIRRFLESTLFISFFPSQDLSSKSWVDVLHRTLRTLSKNKVGALIVLQQQVPLKNLIRGGNPLNGDVSFPLLCSIFDTHSVGHDGAVILRGSKVMRFGAHLPLSRKFQATGRLGTRHAAALGLSELSDALIFVVSEETGDVSLASQGSLEQISPADLESRLTLLATPVQQISGLRRLWERERRSWALQVLCIASSFLLWLGFVAPRNLEQRTISMPITLENLPPDLIVDDPTPDECKVTLMGSEDTFARWSKDQQRIRLSLSHVRVGTEKMGLSTTNLALPRGIFLKNFEPAIVSLKAHKSRTVSVPVVVSRVGRMPASTPRLRTEPTRVNLVVREGDPGPSVVMTEPVDFSQYSAGDKVELRLVPPPKAQFSEKTPPTVRVVFEKREEGMTRR